jgi:transposase
MRGLSLAKVIPIARRLGWRAPMTPLNARLTIKGLADRWTVLDAEIRQLDGQIESLVEDAAPRLVALPGVGSGTGGALLVAISFAHFVDERAHKDRSHVSDERNREQPTRPLAVNRG